VLRDLIGAIGDLFRTTKRPETAIGEKQAIVIAQRAAAGQPGVHLLTMTTLKEDAGKLTWVVSTAGVGSTITVCVDATTGEVLHMQRHAGR
jgi:uncharacterized membrane protein YkoI